MAALPWPTPKVWLVKINSRSARASFFSLSLSFFGFLNCAIFTRFAAFMALLGLPSCWAGEQRGGGEFFHCFAKLVGRCEQLNASPVNVAFQSKLVSKSSLKAKAKSKCSRS